METNIKDDVFLIETKNNSLSIKVRGQDGSTKLLHSIYDPEGEAKRLVDAFRFDGNGIVVILGLGLGYHVKELSKKFPDAVLVVVEYVPEVYNLARNCKVIDGIYDKTMFIIGRTPDDVIKEITKEQINKGLKPLNIFQLSSAVSIWHDYYEPIITRLKRAVQIKLWDRLKFEKFREETIRVALIDFNYFLTREIEKAIKGIGCKVITITFPLKLVHEGLNRGACGNKVKKSENGDEVISRLIKIIIEQKPDFFLTINHLGFDEDGSLTDFFKSIEMPAASWYVDSPDLIIKAHKKNVSPYTSIFLWDKGYIEDMKSIGFENVHYLPLGTDECVFRPISPDDTCLKSAGTSKRLKSYICDVGFVGNSMVERTNLYLSRVEKSLHYLVERLADMLSSMKTTLREMIERLVDEERKMVEGLEPKERMDFERAVLWKATLKYRLAYINQLKGFNVRIHGDEGWKGLLDESFNIGNPLSYYKELPFFYNACKINFNATNLQMGHAVNQRVFDVPACGGFILTDYQEALDDLFEVGKEIVVYKGRDDIPELVRFYLNNPDERKRIAAAGRCRVLKEHTYKHRVKIILSSIMARYR